MPAKSKAQLRAMYAAANGKSALGIPKSVGQEYVAATPKKKRLPSKVKNHPDSPMPKFHTAEHN